jgi:ABC-2 type transport system ATP-binding protein
LLISLVLSKLKKCLSLEDDVIELRHLVKKYGPFPAVDDVSLKVEQGKIFGFLGPNGAGKTTTIKMMTGLSVPTSGACLIDDIDVAAHPVEAKLAFGYVPDQPFLYDKLTGREFLQFVGGLFRMSDQALRAGIEEFVALFEMEEFIDRSAEEYSQGMRQRVALASALVHQPKALIIDEPLLGLDPRSAWLVKTMLKKRAAEGLTVFMSTHLLRIVEEVCDRIAIIKKGRIIYEAVLHENGSEHGRLEQTFLDVTG